MSEFPSFLRLMIFSCITYHRLFVHAFVRGYVSCFHLLVLMNNVATIGVQNLLESLLSIFLVIYPAVEVLDHLVLLFLTFWGTPCCFPQLLCHFTLPPAVYRACFSTSLLTFVIFCFLVIAILMSEKRYLILVLICMSLVISDVEHLLLCVLVIIKSFLEKYLFKFLTYSHGVCFVVVQCRHYLYTSETKPLSEKKIYKCYHFLSLAVFRMLY